MEWIQWVVTVGVSLIAGTVGGVVFAPRIGRRTELGRRRLEAETAVRNALREYRDQMNYRHAEVAIRQNFPKNYVSTESQEQLAEVVLRHLPDLSRRQGDQLARHLVVLVGPWTVKYASQRAFLPDGFRSEESERAWLNKLIADVLEVGDEEGFKRGLLGAVRHDVHDRDACNAAEQALTDMVNDASIRRDLPRSLTELRARWSQRKRITRRFKELSDRRVRPEIRL